MVGEGVVATVYEGVESWRLATEGVEVALAAVASSRDPYEVTAAIDELFPSVEAAVEARLEGGRAVVYDQGSGFSGGLSQLRALLAPYADPDALEDVLADRVAVVCCWCPLVPSRPLAVVSAEDREPRWVALPPMARGDCLLTVVFDTANTPPALDLLRGRVVDDDEGGVVNDAGVPEEAVYVRAMVFFHPRANIDLIVTRPFVAPHINRILRASPAAAADASAPPTHGLRDRPAGRRQAAREGHKPTSPAHT